MRRLLQNLPLLARRDFASLRRICGVDEEDLADMIAEIKRLNPKPADAFLTPPAAPIVPDIFLRPTSDGGWHLELNSESLPRVLFNRRYRTGLSRHLQSRDDKDYVASQIQSANWLVRALEQRATTILKVAREIVRCQDGFFRRGVQHLRPLTLRDVAEAVDLHESTVSRATAGKYIDTPRGTFDLKYFFTTALAGADGASHSAEAVRHRIRQLIAAETAKAVLSDDSIVAILQRDGIDIARRTVAKYRESMRIPASFQRRREKSLEIPEGGACRG
jgi:RNA polymerase sigma-54 factor